LGGEPMAAPLDAVHRDHASVDGAEPALLVVGHPALEGGAERLGVVGRRLDQRDGVAVELGCLLLQNESIAAAAFEPARQPRLPVLALDAGPICIQNAISARVEMLGRPAHDAAANLVALPAAVEEHVAMVG